MTLQIRHVAGSATDTAAWFHALATGFQKLPSPDSEEIAQRSAWQDLRRAYGGFDGERCVATYRSFDQQLTVPGGASVPANAVTAVTVTPSHRRLGLLSRMMNADLAAARERGDVVATLIAAEYRIYGRFGFGPGASTAVWEVEGPRTGLDTRRPLPADGGSLSYAEGTEVRKLGPALHERFRRLVPGAVDRQPLWWERATGGVRFASESWQEPFHVLYRDAEGTVAGLATYAGDGEWSEAMPAATAAVRDLIATTPAAERALWHLLLSLDWVTTVRSGLRAPDDLLPALLPDPRAARVREQADFMWLRPLDVPRMLRARRYATAGELVLQVRDPLGLAQGRFLLRTDEEGADCAPTTRSADLTLSTGALSSLYLGDAPAARLAALGALDEETPGAVARADLLLRTARRPWCPDVF